MKKYKKGAASFYVVAISTLILVIIAASFAALIVSEVSRTSNDDLAQSAYDAALAGVEDAKLAFMNYQECRQDPSKTFGSGMSCSDLLTMVNEGTGSCDMVAKALGRPIVDKEGQTINASTSEEDKMGVLIQEGTDDSGNQMNQYYTCTTISAKTDDYLGVLTTEDFEHSVQIKFDKELGQDASINTSGVTDPYQDVDRIRLSWHSFGDNAESGDAGKWFTWMQPNGTSAFGTSEVTPAMMTLTLVQTGPTFSLNEFNTSQGDQTNRGTLYLIPVNADASGNQNVNQDGENYYSLVDSGYDTGNKPIEASALTKSNDKNQKNKPYLVYCDTTGSQDYACMVDIDIPKPIGGTRNPETFVVSVSASYGAPKTDYQLEFFSSKNQYSMPFTLDGVQISIDSTGRANDLFRRVDTRLEGSDATYPYPFFGVETLQSKSMTDIIPGSDGSGGGDAGIQKDFIVECEYNFDDLTCPSR